jgi:uncharacterized FlaG/YvyC family protein
LKERSWTSLLYEAARLPGNDLLNALWLRPLQVLCHKYESSRHHPSTRSKRRKEKVDATELNKAVSDINKSLQDRGQDLRFSIDSDSKRVVVKIIDQNTSQVLRQIPSEEALEISKSLDKLQGLLIKQNA